MSFGESDPPLPSSSQIQTDIRRAGFKRIQRIITFLQEHRKNYADVDMLLDLSETRFNEYVRPECNLIRGIKLELPSKTGFPGIVNLTSGKQIAECLEAENLGMSLADYIEQRWHPEEWAMELEKGLSPAIPFKKGRPTVFVPSEEGVTIIGPPENTSQFSSELESLKIGQEKLEEGQRELRKLLSGKLPLSIPPETPQPVERILTETFPEVGWADIGIIKNLIKGHTFRTIPRTKTRFNIVVEKLPFESEDDFLKWYNDIKDRIEEAKGKRLSRRPAVSRFALRTSSSGERGYAESVIRNLGKECYEYRTGDLKKREQIQNYINYALNLYFSGLEEEEEGMHKEVAWDFMDSTEFPLSAICKEIAQGGMQAEKLERVGEIVDEWAGTEGGRGKF